jgi:hypothetical protein
MISAIVAMMLSQAAAPPPPAAETGPIRRHSFTIRTPSLSYPEAMAPMVREYSLCIHPVGQMPKDPELGYEGPMQARIAGCKAMRHRAAESALAVYKKRPDRPGNRREQVAAIFDSLEQGALMNARYLDGMDAEKIQPPDDGGSIDLISDRQHLSVPREIMPAVEPYLRCMMTDTNGRLKGATSGEDARFRIESLKVDCRAKRDEANSSAVRMLQKSRLSNSERPAMIEKTLSSIDRSHDTVIETLDRAKARGDRK